LTLTTLQSQHATSDLSVEHGCKKADEQVRPSQAPENQGIEIAALKARVLGDLRLMDFTTLPANWESRVIGRRRGISFAEFLRMELFAPLFPLGSIQPIARRELLSQTTFKGSRDESSAVLTDFTQNSGLYPKLGYWDTRRVLRCIFNVYDGICSAIERNDALVVSQFERPKRTAAYKARERARLRARHSEDPEEIGRAKRAVLARLYKRVGALRWDVRKLKAGAERKLAKAEMASEEVLQLMQQADRLERELAQGGQ
jgi:hypothetical protein